MVSRGCRGRPRSGRGPAARSLPAAILLAAAGGLCAAPCFLPTLQGTAGSRRAAEPPHVALAGARHHDSGGVRTSVGVAAKAEEGEVAYDYLVQEYYLKSKAEVGGPDLLTQLSELLPWSSAEREALALQEETSPRWRQSPLGPRDEADLRRRFRAVAAAAGGEAAALSAIRRNPAVLLFGEGTVRRAGLVLAEGLGAERAREVIQKNPGVLTIDASNLRGNLLAVSVVADAVDVVVRNSGAARALLGFVQLGVAVSLGKALFDVFRLRVLDPA
mmetsp:Transcript_130696/g.406401  ORF Transcript_130696/g.406401 Transcript_130696/m.406401 type:complete len:274 (-) Transcript_130696:157-978(-)